VKKILFTAVTVLALTSIARAEETTGEKVDSKARHATTDVKKAGRKVEDKMCAKSDAKCAADKAKHAGQNAGDKVEDAAKDVKNKAD